MGRHILAVLLGGILVIGVSTALAEEPQPSDQEVLKAWGQTQMEVQQISETVAPEWTHGPQLLTDEDLAQVTGAGWGFRLIGSGHLIGFDKTRNNSRFCFAIICR